MLSKFFKRAKGPQVARCDFDYQIQENTQKITDILWDLSQTDKLVQQIYNDLYCDKEATQAKTETKKCSRCQNFYGLDNFYNNRGGKHSYCKVCHKATSTKNGRKKDRAQRVEKITRLKKISAVRMLTPEERDELHKLEWRDKISRSLTGKPRRRKGAGHANTQ